MLNATIKTSFVAACCVLMAACANNAPAPVVDLSSSNLSNTAFLSRSNVKESHVGSKKQLHIVKAGETLFSIAWRYSLDFKALSKINGITGNRIYPGQTLILKSKNLNIFDSGSLVSAINKDVLNKPLIASKKNNYSNSKLASIKSSGGTKTNSRKSNKASSYQIASHSSNRVERWIWPVNGKVINRFSNSSTMNKGLDITAKRGSPVRATAEGKVVYSGDGLRGYGQLVIIKHNEVYLSAYAHNDKLHVEENEFVKAGQKIADLGSTDSDKEKLHFEIRFKGKPVDPLNYLPKSGML